MPVITGVRPVLLSCEYGDAGTSMENRLHLPGGYRTSGFVEIVLDDGTVGIGEGYLAVFAPEVFRSIVDLLTPVVLGRPVEPVSRIVADLVTATGYWSLQGAARHVLAAFEIALQDVAARLAGLPLWRYLGGTRPTLQVYASGGDSSGPEAMAAELEAVAAAGIRTFKIRARSPETDKAVWTQSAAAERGVDVAIDMTQNLVIPSQGVTEVLAFLASVEQGSGRRPVFVEEALGPDRVGDLPRLREASGVPVAGGEIVTTDGELAERVAVGCYDIVQPDATVIGGIGAVLRVFEAGNAAGIETYPHCWGAAVGVLANYHAAVAAGGTIAEWPLPACPLRDEVFGDRVVVESGRVRLPDAPGLGVEVTREIEKRFPFRPDAVYRCLVDSGDLPAADPGRWR